MNSDSINSVSTLGKIVRAERKRRGQTLADTAKLAGLGVRFLSEFERGKETAEIGKIMSVLSVLGLEILVQTHDTETSIHELDTVADLKGEYRVNELDMTALAEVTALTSQQAISELITHYHINYLALFGSAARQEIQPSSDIDLLIDFEKGKAPSLSTMVRIKDAFSELFSGRKVDIATRSILNNPFRRRQIEKDLVVLYAA